MTLSFLACAALAQDLHQLAADNVATTLEEQLEAGANPDVRDQSGKTPLMFAAAAGSMDTLSLLLEHGADVDAQSDEGWTALMFTASAPPWSPGAAALLLRAGADPIIRNAEDESASAIAERMGRLELARLLKGGEVLRHALGPNQPSNIEVAQSEQGLYVSAVLGDRDVVLAHGTGDAGEILVQLSEHMGVQQHLADVGLDGRFTPTVVSLADPNGDQVADLLVGGACECESAVLLALFDGASGRALSVSAIPSGDFSVPRNAFVFPSEVPVTFRAFLEGVLAREEYSVPFAVEADYVQEARFTPARP